MMTVAYRGKVKLRMKRTFPKQPNLCKLTVFSNALNHFGFKPKLTPETLLDAINERRKLRKLPKLNPDKVVIPDNELDGYLCGTGLGESKTFMGERYFDTDLWKKMIHNKILVSPDHQLLYYPLKSNHLSFNFIPKALLKKIEKEDEFDYDTLIEFYNYLLKRYKSLDEGHVDICLDVKESKNGKHIVLANLNSAPDRAFALIPWKLFKHYLSIDWENYNVLRSTKQFPSKRQFPKLIKKGLLNVGKFEFVYSMVTFIYPTVKKQKFKEIMSVHKKTHK